MISQASPGNNQGAAQVTTLLEQLRSDLQKERLSPEQRKTRLEQLKVLGRNPANSASIFAREGIETLCEYGFDVAELDVSQEALRCLANAMLLQEKPRQYLLDLGYGDKAAQRLRNDDRDDEFLVSRIIFLLTYKTDVDLKQLVQEQDLAESICRNIAGHADRYSEPDSSTAHQMSEMALGESLKLLFNITAREPELASKFTSSVSDLFSILSHKKIPSPPLQPQISYIINALMSLNITQETCPTKPQTQTLISILDLTLKSYKEQELDQIAVPLLTLLRKIQESATPEIREYLQSSLFPDDAAREKPLGQGDSLPSHLLRLSISPAMITLHESISALFYELSDKDATKLIQNIGYGYAAGFLATHKIEVPEGAMRADAQNQDVNPITGQKLDKEAVDDLPEMTEEEKEREAERLFVLFERLKATGVVDVKNPVLQAMEEGRY